MKRLIFVLLLVSSSALAIDIKTYVPPKAKEVIPTLRLVQKAYWPDNPYPYLAGSQAEQESCVSLTSKRCWDTHSELKTKREYGFGLFQITTAYKADGSERFNNFKIYKQAYKPLNNWQWNDRYDAKMQMTAYVLTMKKNYMSASYAKDPWERSAFAFVTYNSGSPNKDRTLCANIKGCNPSIWYKNVELHSYKSNKAMGGVYGKQTIFNISRTYPKNIQYVRSDKYKPLFK